jgi:hypothetical protein
MKAQVMIAEKVINGIYFSEISDKIEGRFLTYLGFDDVDIDTFAKGKNLYFYIRYQGKYGRKIDAIDEEGFISYTVDYSWTLKLVNPKVDLIDNHYENVTLHIFKPFLFRGVKVTIKDSEDNLIKSFRVQKSILERVMVE